MATSPMIYLFLDFDGVAHPLFAGRSHQPWEHASFCYLPEFERAVRLIQQPVRIVITSTWRKTRDLAALRAPFSSDIAPLVIGKTPEIGAGNSPGARWAEVQAWMKQNARDQDVAIAIDDVGELYLGPHNEIDHIALVACPDRFGPEQGRALLQACADPNTWRANHPIERHVGLVIVGANRA